MYILHIANKNYSSWSLRPWVLMSELGIPFEERLSPFGLGPYRDAFLGFSPSGLVPCLHDGETRVWDSLAIIEYLAERHPGVWPRDSLARSWARSAAAEMHSGFGALRSQCSMNCGVRVRLNAVSPDLKRDLDRLEELWRDGLDRFGGPFLAGSAFTAVDAFFCPVAFRIQSYELSLSPEALAYAARLRDLPPMRDWYNAALTEPWRDPPHEANIAEVGHIIADLRQNP